MRQLFARGGKAGVAYEDGDGEEDRKAGGGMSAGERVRKVQFDAFDDREGIGIMSYVKNFGRPRSAYDAFDDLGDQASDEVATDEEGSATYLIK